VQIPAALLPQNKVQFYCEVRDFQRNVLTGFATVQPGKAKKITLALFPSNRLPALQKAFRSTAE
jgi:hypothetical protein